MAAHEDITESVAHEGRPCCGAHGRQRNRPCANPPGFRTDHPGIGRCFLHGGRNQPKHGRYSVVLKQIVKEQFADVYERERSTPDIANLRDEIALLRTMLSATSDLVTGTNQEKAIAVVQLIESIGRNSTRLTQNESVKSQRLSQQDLGALVQALVAILTRHVSDPTILGAIMEDLRHLGLPNEAPQLPEMIETALVEESTGEHGQTV